MINRRSLLAGGLALAASSTLATPALANRLPRRFRPRQVQVNADLAVGSIHVVNADHFLYHVTAPGEATRYGVALGEVGRQFVGVGIVSRKAEWPSWRPTANMIRQEPEVYGPYAAGLPGGHPMNPMGARALYLNQNGRPTYFRIHGTPQPHTIGRSFSSGCIRLVNEHVEDLYDRVPVGTVVYAHA